MSERTVLLFGRSLLLPLVAASLDKDPGLHIMCAATWPETMRLLAERAPHAVIFDLAGDCESHVLPLLFSNPDLILIGLDPERNQAMLVSGREAQALTLDQIRALIAGR
jgi:hypothetical protein